MKNLLLTLLFVFLSAAASAQTDSLGRRIWPAVYDGHWHLEATINDSIKGNFIFDTGAAQLSMDTLYYSRSGFKAKMVGRSIIGGVGAKRQMTRIIMDTVRFRYDTAQVPFAMTPLIVFKPMFGRYADGIVGWQYFAGRVVEFNYAGQYLRIMQPGELESLQGYAKLPLKLNGTKFFVTATAEMQSGSKVEGPFILDMGSGGSLSFTTAAALQYHMPAEGKSAELYSSWGGLGGETLNKYIRVKSITLGGFAIDAPIVDYSLDISGALSSGEYLGLLGNKVLERFDVIIDFAGMNLYLKPNAGYGKEWALSRSGFRCVDRTDICDGWVVTSIYRGSNAGKAGLQIGSVITHIDGVPLKGMTRRQVDELLDKGTGMVTLSVGRADRAMEIRFTLQDMDI